MTNIFCLYTEHQFDAVENALNYYRVRRSNAVLFVFCPGSELILFKEMGQRLCFESYFHDVFYIAEWSIRKSFWRRSESAVCFEKILLQYCNEECNLFSPIYNSDSVNLVCSILKIKDFFVLDDGNASFSVLVQRKNKINISFYSLFSSLYHRRNLFLRLDSITYVTKYNLPISPKDKIDLLQIERINNELNLDFSAVIILGSSIYEDKRGRSPFLHFCDYFNILLKLSKRIGDKVIYYYPHRREPRERLEKIKSLGFIVMSHNSPFEKVFQKLNTCPFILFSFGSPILDNIGRAFVKTPRMVILKPDLRNFPNKGADYDLIYEDFGRKNYLEVLSHDKIDTFDI